MHPLINTVSKYGLIAVIIAIAILTADDNVVVPFLD
jgi:Flp pilus assembly pilin Flp